MENHLSLQTLEWRLGISAVQNGIIIADQQIKNAETI